MKNYLRKKYIDIRKTITNKDKKATIIKEKLFETIEYKNALKIGIYFSLKNEVDTTNIIKSALEEKRHIYLPKIINEKEMVFVNIDSIENLEKNAFGIYEPKKGETIKDINELDLIIMPGICFDKEKNRIGFGKGYYDRALENYKNKKIALCFDDQVLKNKIINSDIYDVKIDTLITEKSVY